MFFFEYDYYYVSVLLGVSAKGLKSQTWSSEGQEGWTNKASHLTGFALTCISTFVGCFSEWKTKNNIDYGEMVENVQMLTFVIRYSQTMVKY